MKEKAIISTISLAATLASYFYAKSAEKDAVPYVMIGGFVGALIGEVIIKKINNDKTNKE